ncbi:MAG TPA: hypothetical protein VFX70_06930 [Mycobacteriales bacterium]|nr:hypothetical protein [Mycobacteriales bacterium]
MQAVVVGVGALSVQQHGCVLELVHAHRVGGSGREQLRVGGHRAAGGDLVQVQYPHAVRPRARGQQCALSHRPGTGEDHHRLLGQPIGDHRLQVSGDQAVHSRHRPSQ